MTRITRLTFSTLAVAALSLTGCSETQTPQASAPAPASAPESNWLLVSEPAGALSIAEAKTSAKEGEQIVLRGRIGGRMEPLTDGSPVFTMMDLKIPACGDAPDDHCRTPWDYCCETPDTITANSATVQIMDSNGNPITESPTAKGLAALDVVVVVGTVAPRPTESVLTVKATGVYRVDG